MVLKCITGLCAWLGGVVGLALRETGLFILFWRGLVQEVGVDGASRRGWGLCQGLPLYPNAGQGRCIHGAMGENV